MHNKKKILIFTPGGVGGAERMSVLIGKLLPKDRFEVKYVVIGRLRNIYNILPDGYEVDRIPVRNKYMFSTIRIWWKIFREKPDVVFASHSSYNSRVIRASLWAGRKVIIRSSNMIGKYSKKTYKKVSASYPRANLLIAQQEEMREEMIRLLKVSPNKVITIQNPLDTNDIDALSSVPSPYPKNDQINIVNVARIHRVKSQDVAIKALAIVKKALPQAHLYFVGGYNEKNDYYNSLRTLITNYQLEDCVHFVGYDKNPYRWVRHADCFVLPSRVEGLPNALVEASYLGVPCVATRCLAIVDDIIKDGQNGFVVDVNNVESFAEALQKAVTIKDCKMVYHPGTSEEIIKVFDSV
jgi:glycosyltransferase involved in cell wall biosynthesis